MIELEFVGGAGTVTGSKYVVRSERATVLLECGLFQGRRKESFERNRALPVDPAELDAVVLSHAHLDHAGALPVLWKQGYRGPIYTTPATRDLCAPMLADAAALQLADARHIDKLIARGVAMDPVAPLYTHDDVLGVLELMFAVPYHRGESIAPGVTVTFHDAGHVLGSAVVALDIEDSGERTRLAFTGDLGRAGLPILRDPEIIGGAHALLTESTYGDRLHPPLDDTVEVLAATVRRTIERGGKVIIPAFALERAQELVFALKKAELEGKIPRLPVYVDSPLTVKVTDVFRLHPECYDEESRALLRRDSPFDFPTLEYVADKEESVRIDADPSPCVIISASGMCESGRVLHHLKATIEDDRNTVCIVGFQAQHTLGRRLVEKRARVKIFGVERDRRAEVVVLNGFSAHADQRELVEFAVAARDRGKLRRVALVHGEPKSQAALTQRLAAEGFPDVVSPLPAARWVI